MNKLCFVLSVFLLLLVNINNTQAAPDIRGFYSGTCTTAVSNCSNSNDDGTYNADLIISISIQNDNTFSGTAKCTYTIGISEDIELSGTITDSGQISGTTTHTFSDGSEGEGTFSGQLSGETLTIENPGQDTSGDTCSYTRSMTAQKVPLYASFSADLSGGNPPLTVSFSDESTGGVSSWNWNFGDGSSSTIQNPSHTYTDEGRYSVSLTVSGPEGYNTVTKSDYICVTNIVDLTEYKISPPSGSTGDYFGSSVSTSGNFVIVGAYGEGDWVTENHGAAYIFEKSESGWNQIARLTASDAGEWDSFGRSVSISGNYAIVGAYGDDYSTGAAYIFEKLESGWTEVAKLTASDASAEDNFGLSVSISGNYAIMGAYIDDNGTGAAYIFERTDSGWSQVAKLTASDAATWSYFGYNVSISGNHAIVSANGIDSYTGAAYIFERTDSGWNQTAKLTASDAAEWDYFGCSVSISGDNAIVGANADDDNGASSGSAYIFEKANNEWTQVAKLTANDADNGDFFGAGVSIFGSYAVVGANGNDFIGSAYVFEKTESGWNQAIKLTAYNVNDEIGFGGFSVYISGDYIIAGASKDNTHIGSAYIYNFFPDEEASPQPEETDTKPMPWLPLLLE